ncbi:MAG: 2-hydroxyacyl-CoA dehydratase [Dehalococcoidales bacterium]|nr:2-hydroxyacyl-CoA dehydratase [Dehalococcoidales bacterium]
MNLIEQLIERNEKRVKKIEANPDPARLNSNLLGYKLDIDHYRELQEAWAEGKPLFPYSPSSILARAMGAPHVQYETFVDQVPQQAPLYYQVARSMGFPENVCDTIVLAMAAVKLGDVPPPSLVTSCPAVPCRVWTYHMKMLAEISNAPMFEIDIPQEYTEESVRYLADQFTELIRFAESKVPGIKYDQDKLVELLKGENEWTGYASKEWEMKKLVPLPWDSRESFRQPFRRGIDYTDNASKILEFWRQRTDELAQYLATGIHREERLRVLWIWGRPVYVDPINVLAPRVVSVPAVVLPGTLHFGGRNLISKDEETISRKLTPLEQIASEWIAQDVLGRCRCGGRGWAEDVIWACKELKCDAIVYYQVIGCLHLGSLAKLVTDMAERQLGVPTLILAGREMEPTFLPPEEFESKLAEFLDMVLLQKALR